MVDERWPNFERPDDGEELRVHPAGELLLESGAVVVCDPFVPMNKEPLDTRVKAGRYPVDVLVLRSKGDTRVAMARVRLGSSAPSRWKRAVWPGQDERTLGPGQIFGYGVDAGTGCFADPAALEAFGELDDPIGVLEDMGHTWSVGSFEDGARSVVAFSSGYGDGVYASWWGLDDSDEVVALVTDFGVLDVHWPEAGTDPKFRKAYARETLDRLLALAPKIRSGSGEVSQAYELSQEVRSLRSDLGDGAARLLRAVFEHADNEKARFCLSSAIDWSDEARQSELAEALEQSGYERGWPVLEEVADQLRWETLLPEFAAWVHEGAKRHSSRWATALSVASEARTGNHAFFAPAAEFVEMDWWSGLRARAETAQEYERARVHVGAKFIQPSLQLLAQAPSLPESTIEGLVQLLDEGQAPWSRQAMRLLENHDASRLRPFLTAEDVGVRVLAAEVILRDEAEDPQALATVRAVIDDPQPLPDEVRASAVDALPDKEQRKRAYLDWAIAGSRVGLFQEPDSPSVRGADAHWIDGPGEDSRRPRRPHEPRNPSSPRSKLVRSERVPHSLRRTQPLDVRRTNSDQRGDPPLLLPVVRAGQAKAQRHPCRCTISQVPAGNSTSRTPSRQAHNASLYSESHPRLRCAASMRAHLSVLANVGFRPRRFSHEVAQSYGFCRSTRRSPRNLRPVSRVSFSAPFSSSRTRDRTSWWHSTGSIPGGTSSRNEYDAGWQLFS